MVGLPLAVPDSSASVLFPGATPNTLFEFSAGYRVPDNQALSTGRGYWLRFPSDGNVEIVGQGIPSNTLILEEGWNMISGPTCRIPAGLVVDGDLTLDGTLFGFDGLYQAATELVPGHGYWIRASRAGTLDLDCSATGKNARVLPSQEGWETLAFRDASGVTKKLYMTSGHLLPGAYTLPPAGPSETWRVAYDVGRYVGTANAGEVIRIDGEAGDLVVTSSVDISADLLSASGGLMGQIVMGQAPQEISQEVRGIRISGSELPMHFALHSAYPNPFNPVTNIAFDLPGSADVRLVVYDLLGRRVMQLAQEGLPAGASRTMQVDGSRLASGQYFYRIEARMASGVEAATGTFVLLK